MAEIEACLQDDIRSKDPKVRHPAVRLLLMVKRETKDTDDSPVLDPLVQKLLGKRYGDLMDDVVEVDDEDPNSEDSDGGLM